MAIRVYDTALTSDLTEIKADRVSERPEWWIVSGRYGVYSRNQAVTAMTIAEYRATGRGDSPHVRSWEQELLVPVMPVDAWALLQTLKVAAAAVLALPGSSAFRGKAFGGDVNEFLTRVGEAVGDLGAAVQSTSYFVEDLAGGNDIGGHWAQVESQTGKDAEQLTRVGTSLQRTGQVAQAGQDRAQDGR